MHLINASFCRYRPSLVVRITGKNTNDDWVWFDTNTAPEYTDTSLIVLKQVFNPLFLLVFSLVGNKHRINWIFVLSNLYNIE